MDAHPFQEVGAREQQAKRILHSSSLSIFRRYLSRTVLPNGEVQVNANKIHSRAAFEDWLASRGPISAADPEKAFQRSLTAHLTGVDGRTCFDVCEEKAILAVLRRKGPWPCFVGTLSEKRGSAGFRSWGFHEKTRIRNQRSSAAASAAASAAVDVDDDDCDSTHQGMKRWAPPPQQECNYSANDQTSLPEPKRIQSSTAVLSAAYSNNCSIVTDVGSAARYQPEGEDMSHAPSLSSMSTNESEDMVDLDFLMLPCWQDMHTLPKSPSPTLRAPALGESSLANPPCSLTSRIPCNMPQQPTVYKALQCLAEYERRHPGYAVVVFNTLAGSTLTELFIAQNELSLKWIGAVAQSHAGTARALVEADEIPGLMRVLLLLAQGEFGGEIDSSCRVQLVDGSMQLVRLTLWQSDKALVCVGAKVVE